MTLGVSNLQVLILHSSPEETLGILTLPPLSLPPPPGFCYSVCHFYAIRTCSICISFRRINSRLFGLDLYSKGSSPPFHTSIISVLCALTPLVSDLISFSSKFSPGVGSYFPSLVSCMRLSVLLPCFRTAMVYIWCSFLRFIFIHWVVWAPTSTCVL